MQLNQLRAGVVLSYIAQASQILITLLYTPVMLSLLGQSEYGLYQIVFSVVGFLGLFNFGFSSSYIRFYTRAIYFGNPDKAVAELNGTYLIIFAGLGLLVLLTGVWMAFNTDVVLGGKLTFDELNTAQVLMFIMVFNCALHFFVIVFNNFIIAHEKFIILQCLHLLTVILNPCLTFPLLLMGYGSVSLCVALLTITLIQLIVAIYYSLKKLNIRFKFDNLQFSLLKEIGMFSFYIFLESLISLLNISADRFLIGKLVGTIATAIYAVGGQINTLYMYLSTSISTVFTPKINRLVEECDEKALNMLFVKVGKVQFGVLLLVLCGFTVFGQRFMDIWVGAGYQESFWVALILIVPNTINLIQNVAYEIQRAKNLQKYRSLMWFGIAVLNVLSSIFLIRIWGATGAAIGTALAWIIGSGFVMNWFYAIRVGLDVKVFWKEILFMAKGGVLPLLAGLVALPYINGCSMFVFFLLMLLFAGLYTISLLYTGLKSDDRKSVFVFVKGYTNKITRR